MNNLKLRAIIENIYSKTGVIPYKIDKNSIVDLEHQELIRESLLEIHEVVTCIQFREIEGDALGDYFLFRAHGDDVYPGKGCWA